jgi:hypothetical protein
MSRIPSLKDILNHIPDEVSDSDDEGEFENIEYVEPKRSFLDIPEEYTKLNVPRNQNQNYNHQTIHTQQNQYIQKPKIENKKIVPLTESNLELISNEPLISYGLPQEESIETRSKKSHKSHKSHKSSKSITSSIDFSVGEDNQKRLIKYDRDREDDTRSTRSSVSSLSMGSIKSNHSYQVENRSKIIPGSLPQKSRDDQSVLSKISKAKSHISVSSMSLCGSESSRTSVESKTSVSKQMVPLSSSIYPKKMEDLHGFNKFSNQNKEEEKAKVDIKKIRNIEEFKNKVNHYIALDDEIRTLTNALKERRREKQRFEGEILQFMKENEIETIKSKLDNSSIELLQRKKTQGLTKEYLVDCLMNLLKNKNTSDQIATYIFENRSTIQRDVIKRVQEGKSKKKKNKY